MLIALLFALTPGGQTALNSPQASVCGVGLSASAAAMCSGEEQARLAELEQERIERLRRLNSAAQHYKRAADLASSPEEKARALNARAEMHDARHLRQLDQMELILRELIAVQPDELSHVFRLARVQEDRGFIDAAENSLLSVRHQWPTSPEPYRILAQFYSRRVVAMEREMGLRVPESEKPRATLPGSGPDENGIYRVGGPVTPPRRIDVTYPPEARAAGIEGVVIVEAVISELGNVTDVKILRSIPLLDEAALDGVRKWQYTPTVVNGKAVPVRMTVTVNFTGG